jgi:VIT1/CCC1 family predicted Fe2+/Mn2+ transporter
VSVRSQAELSQGLIGELRRLIARNPKLVLDELVEQLVKDGFDEDTARQASTELPLDEERFMSFTARSLFGVNPDEHGSPMVAAVSSMTLFALGAALPLLPWFFAEGTAATVVSIVLTAVASLAVGAGVSAASGNSAVRGGLRQLAIVVLASAVTLAIGKLFGTAIA